MQNNIVRVNIWGREVGRLFWDERKKRSIFTYNPQFLKDGLDIAPISASIKDVRARLAFYGRRHDEICQGLPSFIADSLPGRWGNAVFDAWAVENHIRSSQMEDGCTKNTIRWGHVPQRIASSPCQNLL